MKLTRKILLAVFAVCMSLGIAAFAAACGKKPSNPKPIDYSITVTCEDDAVLANVQVQLFLNNEAAADAKALDAEHTAVFNLLPQTYTVRLNGAEGYTYPATTVTADNPNATIALTKELYTVTYVLGSCNNTDYAGTATTPPTETGKEDGATFYLADALVWEDHYFMGWNDGTKTYAAGAQYTMPADDVILTAEWMESVTDTNIALPTWNQDATTGGYKIEKGQFVKIAASIGKETGDSAYGINAKIFPNSNVDNNNFYQCRCDFIVKRVNWGWNENNDGFTVEDGGFVRDTYKVSTAGEVEIIVALSEDGVLTYTFKYTSTSSDYAHERVFTDNAKMDSALVIFGLDHSTAENTNLTYPAKDVATVTLDYGDDTKDVRHLPYNSTYVFEENPTRTGGYNFKGWQADGEGTYYKSGDDYTLGKANVTFIAAWNEEIHITMQQSNEGATGTLTAMATYVYNAEMDKYTVTLPSSATGLKAATGYAFKGWEVTVDGEPITVTGRTFIADPGADIVITAVYTPSHTVTYSFGSCEDVNYGGSTKLPTRGATAEGASFALATAIPVWTGYKFLGWSDGEKTYAAGADYTMPSRDVVLTAQWRKLGLYTVTYDPDGCDGVDYAGQNMIDDQPDTYEETVFVLGRAIKWEGYTFLGWSDDDGVTIYPASTSYTMPAHDVTFTAVWEKLPTHSVTYLHGADSADDVFNMPTATTYYEGQIFMTVPMRYGYTFLGWSDGETTYKTGEAINLTSENVTLTAQWQSLAETDAAYATQRTILTGVWEYEGVNGMVYLEISGMEAAWNTFKAEGSYKVGPFVITSADAQTIKFTINADRPAGSGTNTLVCTYHFDGDYIESNYYYGGTFKRAESNLPVPSEDDDDIIVVSLDFALPDEKKRG